MIVAKHNMTAGHVLSMEDLDYRAPGTGLPPSAADRIVGRALSAALTQGQPISESDVAVG